jgi:hypothetical protein
VIAIHANRGEVRAVIDGAMADFEALLTEEQSTRFDALRDARHTFGHHRRGHRPGGPGGEGGGPGQGPFAGPFGGEGGGPGAL